MLTIQSRLLSALPGLLFGALLLFAWALPDSSKPSVAGLVISIGCVLSAGVWLWPLKTSPALMKRPELVFVAAAFFIFALIIGMKPLLHLAVGHSYPSLALFDPSAALVQYLLLAGVAFCFTGAFRMSMTDERGKALLDGVIYAGGIWAVVSILMQIADPNGIYGIQKMAAGRLTGAFSSANSAATLFGSVSVLALGRLIDRFQSTRSRSTLSRIDPAYFACWLATLGALLMTSSRGGMLSTVIASVLIFLVLTFRKMSPVKSGLTLVAAVCVLAVMFAAPLQAVVGRFEATETDAATRNVIFSAHQDIASSQSLFGSGLGSFQQVNSLILSPENYPELSTIGALHNVYLQWYLETGLLGLISLIALNVSIVVLIWLGFRRRQSVGPRLPTVLAAHSVFLLHGFTDYAFQEPALTIFVATILGNALALATNERGRG
ncbi:O-antigen ligase family protein [Asticcacaulis sp. W401b]|uniref:O-antigen ligase family protein n=1 Tax=Asticcacaulis sp. W401b TaxID=3388666 RepID=UPI003970F060